MGLEPLAIKFALNPDAEKIIKTVLCVSSWGTNLATEIAHTKDPRLCAKIGQLHSQAKDSWGSTAAYCRLAIP